ncbi:alpha/beta hydrolase [uncultured Vibrio sp.]|uniref:alpha/beta fold hydrolase n=1 Tax=uncultured Vibrio sp. TaxID=114054 RepID=UPI0025FD49FF|nr:alpha/beta hydrolase [uncultured Vibrio sp.]
MKNWTLTHSFSFEGRTVKYDTKGEGEPLIIVHGTPWSSFNMRHLIDGLSKHYNVYFFDLLGYGESDKSDADVSLGIQNRLLAALIEHWGLDSPYIVGHDFGGTTVLRSHLISQCHYKKMVVIDPVALSPWGSPFFKHVEKHEPAFAGVPDYIHTAIVEAYVKTAAHQKLPQTTLDGILKPWSGELGKSAFYRQIAQADSKFTDEFQDRFSEVSAPTLILWGEEDTWIPCEQAYSLQSKIEGAQLATIPNAGHLVIEEAPEPLINEILNFFRH